MVCLFVYYFLKNMMKKIFLSLLITVLSSVFIYAQAERISPEEQMRKYEPLRQFVGNWRQNFVFSPPGREQIYGKGMLENKMFWAETLLEMTINSEYPTGLTVGKVILGYDRFRDFYFYLNYDAYGTYPLLAQGTYNEKEKMFVFIGQELVTVGKYEPFKVVIKIERDNKFVYELYKGSDNRKVLETVCIKSN